MKNLNHILVFLLLLFLCSCGNSYHEYPAVYGKSAQIVTQNALKEKVKEQTTPDPANLIEGIQSAKEQIDLSYLSVSDLRVIKELKNAANRNVQIRIYLDEPFLLKSILVKKIVNALMDERISIKLSAMNFKRSTAKFFIIDRRSAFVLPHVTLSAEEGKFVNDDYIVMDLSSNFDKKWEEAHSKAFSLKNFLKKNSEIVSETEPSSF